MDYSQQSTPPGPNPTRRRRRTDRRLNRSGRLGPGRRGPSRLGIEVLERRLLLAAHVDNEGVASGSDEVSNVAHPSMLWQSTDRDVPRIASAVRGQVDVGYPSDFIGPQPLSAAEWIVQFDVNESPTVPNSDSISNAFDDNSFNDFTFIAGLGSPGLVLLRGVGFDRQSMEQALDRHQWVQEYRLNTFIDEPRDFIVQMQEVGSDPATVNAPTNHVRLIRDAGWERQSRSSQDSIQPDDLEQDVPHVPQTESETSADAVTGTPTSRGEPAGESGAAVVDWFESLENETGSQSDATWIVQISESVLEPDTSVSDTIHLLRSDGGQPVNVIRGLGSPGLILVRGTDDATENGLSELQRAGIIRYFEANGRVRSVQAPNDPRYLDQLHLSNSTGYNINADPVWDTQTGNRHTIVAIMDSGVDYTHPDLYRNIWINQGEIPTALAPQDMDLDGIITFVDLNDSANQSIVTDFNGNGYVDADDLSADSRWADGIDQDGNFRPDDLFGWDFVDNDATPIDLSGHGTHVAGVLGASGNNSIGTSGVAWDTSIMVLRFLDEFNTGTLEDAILATSYLNELRSKHGVNVRVVNHSWVSLDGPSQALRQQMERGLALDVLHVASAGNGDYFGDPVDNDSSIFAAYPASYSLDNVLAVTATDVIGNPTTFANFGFETVDIAAPGLGILSTTLSGAYSRRSGTSFAAPQVSGAALLLWAENPTANAHEIRDALIQGVEKNATLTGLVSSEGRLDVGGAFASDSYRPLASLADTTPVTVRGLTEIEVQVRFDDKSGIDPLTLGTSDIQLRAEGDPGTVFVPSSFQVIDTQTTSATVIYRFTAPSSVWDVPDNGTYRVELLPGEVKDLVGNIARVSQLDLDNPESAVIGAIEVDVPPVGLIPVTRTDDTLSAGSLRAAVIEANSTPGDNTIVLGAGTYELTIPGRLEGFSAKGDLDVDDASGILTIVGQGPDKTIINANEIDRVIDVKDLSHLILKDLQITGGAIFGSDGGFDTGGGIVSYDATLEIINVRITNNAADRGGGLESYGELIIRDSVIDGNRAEYGGGLTVFEGTALIKDSQILENTALRYAGGIHNLYGAPVIEGTLIEANQAGAAGSGLGGGLYSVSSISVIDSIVRRNTVLVDNILSEQEPNNSLLGAQSISDARWTLRDDPNVGPTAQEIPHITIQGTGDGTFDYYSFSVPAGARGIFDIDGAWGGDSSFDSELFLFRDNGDGTFTYIIGDDDSLVSDGGLGSEPTSTGDTGTYDSYLDHTFTEAGTYVIAVGRWDSFGSSSGASGNRPLEGHTYLLQVSLEGQNAEWFAAGGGIFVEPFDDRPPATAQILRTQVLGNSASAGGGIYSGYDTTMTITDSRIANNAAVTLENVALFATEFYTAGGGVFSNHVLTIEGSEILSNSAGVGGGIDINADVIANTTIRNSLIADNVAKSDEYAAGGGIRNGNAAEGGGLMVIEDTTIRNNLSSFEGGGITNGGTLEVYRSTINDNTSGVGAGIGNWGVATVTNTTVSGNYASEDFDPIVVDISPFGNLIFNTGDGGGIYNSRLVLDLPLNLGNLVSFGVNSEMTLVSSTVTNNRADRLAAGVLAGASTIYSRNTIFDDNELTDGTREDVVAGSPLSDIAGDPLGGSFVSEGKNLIERHIQLTGGDFNSLSSDYLGVDALLGPLSDNSGPTLTHVPSENSLVIDAGIVGTLATDQRGVARPQDGDRSGVSTPDIGAVERYFGDITGNVFNDTDGDSVRDTAEGGLQGWTVYLDLNDNGRMDGVEEATSSVTDSDGVYSISLIEPGDYTVRQVKPRLWMQTLPLPDSGPIQPGNSIANAPRIDAAQWTKTFDANIGDLSGNTSLVRPHISIDGTGDASAHYYRFYVPTSGATGVFDIDLTAGAVAFDSELVLYDSGGLEIARNDQSPIDLGAEGSVSPDDAFLQYTFDDPGEYVIRVSSSGDGPIPVGATYQMQVSLDEYAPLLSGRQITLGTGQSISGLDFGNFSDTSEVLGTVFSDVNGSAVFEDGEFGLPQWRVFLDIDGDKVLDSGTEPFADTDASGNFVIPSVRPGAYQLQQQVLSGWAQSGPFAATELDESFATPGLSQFEPGNDWTLRQVSDGGQGHTAPDVYHFGIDSPSGLKYRAGVDGRVVSPPIDLTDYSGTIFLEFAQRFDVSEHDSAKVLIIDDADDENEYEVADHSVLRQTTDDFATIQVDVSRFGGKEIRVAFEFVAGADSRQESIQTDLIQGQTYYVQVTPTAGQTLSSYDLSVSAQGAPPDRFEPNDSILTATDFGVIDVVTESNLTLHAVGTGNSADFYRFIPSSAGLLEIEIDFEHRFGDLDIFLYDEGGDTIAASQSVSDQEAILASLSDGVAYILEVRGYRGAVNPEYGLRIVSSGVSDDRFEDNDTQATAHDLGTVVDVTEQSLSISNNDDDWYMFQVAQSGETTVGIQFSHSLGDLDLMLVDDLGVVRKQSITSTDNESLSFDAISGQTYFVRVLGFEGDANPLYTLSIDSPGATADRFESNDAFAQAFDFGTLGRRQELGLSIHSPTDADVFRFTAFESGPAEVLLSFDQSQGDVLVSLFDSNQSLIATSRGNGWFIDDVVVRAVGEHRLNIEAGEIYEDVRFGNRPTSSGGGAGQYGVISGVLFEDLNRNRIQDPGELPITGVDVVVDNDGIEGPSAGDWRVKSTEEGFRFEGLASNTYSVYLDAPSSGLQTFPTRNELVERLNANFGENLQSLVLDFLNGDSLLDVAFTSAGESQQGVTILLSTGVDVNGTTQYAPALQRSVGQSPSGIATGSFDGDSIPDVVVANIDLDSVTVLKGQSGYSDSDVIQIPTGDQPTDVITARINDDEFDDLVVAFGSNSSGVPNYGFHVYLGTANGISLVPAHTHTFQGVSGGIALGNLNADPLLDVVMADASTQTIRIYQNTGSGFTLSSTFPVGDGLLSSLAVGNFAVDDSTDEIAVGFKTPKYRIFDGVAGGVFQGTEYSLNASITSLKATDFDLDGDDDLAIGVVNLLERSFGAQLLKNVDGSFEEFSNLAGSNSNQNAFSRQIGYAVTDANPVSTDLPSRSYGPMLALLRGQLGLGPGSLANRVVVMSNRILGDAAKAVLGAEQTQQPGSPETVIKFGFFPEFKEISLSNAALAENVVGSQAVEVGQLSVVDIDGIGYADQTYQFAVGDGDVDNAAFEIVGQSLRVLPGVQWDYEQKDQYSVRIEATSPLGESMESVLLIDVLPRPEITSVVVNGGSLSRSTVSSLTVEFDSAIVPNESAFIVTNRDTQEVVNVNVEFSDSGPGSSTTALLTFLPGPSVKSSAGANGLDLIDGNYRLDIAGSQVVASGDQAAMVGDYAFGAAAVDGFFSQFGDSDGDRDVDGQDYGRFGLSFLKSPGDAGFDARFDFDGDGDVDGKDYGHFGAQFLKRLPF